jgi:hypothetical protein
MSQSLSKPLRIHFLNLILKCNPWVNVRVSVQGRLKLLSKHLVVVFFLAVFLSSAVLAAKADDEKLVLRWEQHWPTYGVGGTCNFGTSNFFVGDVDNDGVTELITGGLTYSEPNYTENELQAPLRIWNWNGENFTLEASSSWAGLLVSIYAADLDGDGFKEIITGAIVTNATSSHDAIRIWRWNNKDLVLLASYEGINARAVFAEDVDKDGVVEILAAGGGIVDFNMTRARLSILGLEGNQLFLEKDVEWCTAKNAGAHSVYASDLDKNGDVEIVTCGYDNGLTNSSGQLRIWRWNGQDLVLEKNEEWRLVEGVYGTTVTGDPMGNTLAENLKVADVDGDGVPEIVTGGFAYDGQKMNAQLRIWNWNGDVLALEKSQEWLTNDITEIKCVSLGDVNGDGHMEIVTSGGDAVYGGFQNGTKPEMAQLRIWSWNGETLNLIQKEDWTIGEGTYAWNVATNDLDNDGRVEIVTVGCMYVSQLCDPDLRIWSLQAASSPESLYYLVAAAVAVSAVLVGAAAYLIVRKNREKVTQK